ncbi:restriction endonuclease [Aristaeella lactis]|uniref:Restriction system protein n=1 Tax=Aristaeella lactis TaxID=3046383 RepID=A0AC61PLD8_9FIRM|nr:restriction endonuclease [Aristaeella lactis]QUA52194.1 restriction endonuclease [Aristaeella lactis]SMC58674.1 restriction system protein [Aristaeella lactis]
MAVPKFFDFLGTFLVALADGKTHTSKEVRTFASDEMKLTAEELAELLPSGKQTTFANRVAWARTYLDRAGLIKTPSKGHYCITEEGKKALKSGVKIDLAYLEKYPSFVSFHSVQTGESTQSPINNNEESEESKTPMEILDDAFKKVNSSLANDLMVEVMKLDPGDFEKLVVQLLLKMGYGSGIDNAGVVTKLSNDGGIDGIIKEDLLGFSSIYIQAKQWAMENTVGRPEIQKFAGALQGEKASKGLFITTAHFSKEAKQYADNLHGSNIVLIDGDALMRLMIKYNLGVSVEQTYEVKRIDSDFFSDSF